MASDSAQNQPKAVVVTATSILLSGIAPTIQNVTLASGAFDSFALTNFTSTSMLFTASTATDFNGIGGQFVSFNVQQTPSVPEPVTQSLLGLGLAGIGARRWRQRKAT